MNLVKAEVISCGLHLAKRALIRFTGIYGPGYSERRKQRLKENHGVEVADPYWETKAEPQPLHH